MPLPSWVISVVLPWTGSWVATVAPKAWPITWWPRQTPRVGTPASGKRRGRGGGMPAPLGGEGAGDGEAEARLVGGARAGRDDDALVGPLEQAVGVGLVVAEDLDVGAQLPQVLDEVVGEAVVVVDDEESHGQPRCCTASSIALSTPRALATDSSYS